MIADLPLLAPPLAFGVTVLMLWWLLRQRIAHVIVDQPNERSLHQTPLPRVGGIALMAGVAAGWGLIGGEMIWPLVFALVALVSLSLFDDWRGLPVALRFAVQSLVCIGYLLIGASELKAVLWLIGTWLAVMWMTNLYNFMDGSDGLAGGMAVTGFGVYALAAGGAGNDWLALLSGCVATAALGFLLFNFHPAKVFLGDAGSIPLGFLAAALGLAGVLQGVWPFWFPVVVFAPFIVDATVTLIRRMMQGEKVWRAHRSHYYQRMVQMGWGHRGTAFAEYALMLLTGAIAMAMLVATPGMQGVLLGVLCLVYGLFLLWVDRAWCRFQKRMVEVKE